MTVITAIGNTLIELNKISTEQLGKAMKVALHQLKVE